MMPDVLSHLPSLGISGLLFVMWWAERQERSRAAVGAHDALQYTVQMTELTERLLDVIRTNTEALTELRDDLRAHRAAEQEWRTQLMHELERLRGRSDE